MVWQESVNAGSIQLAREVADATCHGPGCASSRRSLPGALGNHMRRAFFAIVAMFIGGMIYILWRPQSLLMFSWFEFLGLAPFIHLFRAQAAPCAGLLPNWVCYSLPEALWLFSGLISLDLLWAGQRGFSPLLWLVALSAIAIGSEVGQWVGLLPGSFDPLDLAILVAVCGTAFLYQANRSHPEGSFQ
jgi:hypothetical protein